VYSSGSSEIWLVVGLSVLNIIASRQRHSLERATPFCVYLGLLIYAKTRKKQLIDILFQYD
jgi:hypothetical protein